MLHLLPKSHPLPEIVKAIGHMHRGPSEPRRLYPLHEASYLETELMSRLMEHL